MIMQTNDLHAFFCLFLVAACSYLKPCYPGYCTSNACMCTNNFSPQSSGTSNCLTCEIRFIMRLIISFIQFSLLFLKKLFFDISSRMFYMLLSISQFLMIKLTTHPSNKAHLTLGTIIT